MAVALSKYDEAIRRKPECALAYYNRGTAYLDLGQYQLAVDDYSQAIRLSSRDAEVYAARAFTYALLGKDTEAQQDVERAGNLGFARPFLQEAIEEVKGRSDVPSLKQTGKAKSKNAKNNDSISSSRGTRENQKM